MVPKSRCRHTLAETAEASALAVAVDSLAAVGLEAGNLAIN